MLAACVGCSSGGDGAVASSGGGPGPGSGSSGEPAARSPIAGTWDILGVFGGPQGSGTLTITSTRFALTWDRFDLAVDLSTAAPAVRATQGTDSSEVSTTHAAEPIDFGIVPLPVGGEWTMQGKRGDRCTATVGTALSSLDCSGMQPPLDRTLQGWDFVERKPLPRGKSTAQRKSQLASSFGELGGEWTVLTPRLRCDVKIEGLTFMTSCEEQIDKDKFRKGSLTLTLDPAAGTASGTTTFGGEISARRR